MDEQTRQTLVTLFQTQLWDRRTIVEHQLQLLERLCRHARAHVPFYRDSGRLKPLFDEDDDFDANAWKSVPVLTRAEAWRHRDALQAETVPAVMQPLIPGSTTGSTGTPLPFRRTLISRVMAEAQLARALAWRGLGALNPIVISKAVTGDVAGREPPLKPGETSSSGGGPVHYIDFHLPPAEQVAQIRAIAPRFLFTYPNIAATWAGAGFDFAGVHAVALTGETCLPDTRARIAARFGGPIVELYSASEAGPIAIEGRDGGLNVCEENVFLESPAMDLGQPHPVIITPLTSYGTPLIRYAPGDYAVFAAASSPETPGLRRLERIAGRVRNMFKTRGGGAFWPNLSGAKLMAIAPHTHRQLIQEDYDRFVMRVVFDAPPGEDQLALIRAHVAEVVGAGDITIEAVTAIEDGRVHGKAYENFVCKIA